MCHQVRPHAGGQLVDYKFGANLETIKLTPTMGGHGPKKSREAMRKTAVSITIIPLARGLATSPARRARLRFRQPSSACETKEVRPRLTTAVP